MIAKLRQIEDKEVVCAAAVFSLFLFLKFILFRLLGEYFVTVQSIINKCDEEDHCRDAPGLGELMHVYVCLRHAHACALRCTTVHIGTSQQEKLTMDMVH